MLDNSFMSIALSIKDIRKSEMLLPIARKSAIVTPFLLGDHQVLKTALLSPQNYDREMVKCLYKHLTIMENDVEAKIKYDDLISTTSNIDKICLLWACYRSTYEHLGVRNVACEQCGEKHEYKITLDELIQPDSLTIWEDTEVPFHQYVFPIALPFDEYEYIFESCIPTILRYNQVLGMITIDKIKKNLETNSILSGSEELAVLIKQIIIKKNGDEVAKSSNLQEILTVLDCAIPSKISEDFSNQYSDRFNKYYPKFYTNLVCGSCKHEYKYSVDIETEFFRRVLSGKESVGD